jgi:hypothetical protein
VQRISLHPYLSTLWLRSAEADFEEIQLLNGISHKQCVRERSSRVHAILGSLSYFVLQRQRPFENVIRYEELSHFQFMYMSAEAI